MHGGGIAGNFCDLESEDEYWISGVKKEGSNRHWAGSGEIQIDVNALNEFLHHTNQRELDRTQYEICSDIMENDPQEFYEMETRSYRTAH
jgi:hypothetical protein